MRTLSAREHALLMVALAVVVGFAFYGVRYRPHAARMKEHAEHRELLDRQLAGAKWPVDRGDPQRLSEREEAMRADVERLRALLQRQESRFVSQGDPAAMDELRVHISDLANKHRVRLVENLACPEQELRGFIGKTNSDAGTLVRFLTLGEPYSFRTRRLALETDFAGLRAFLRGLAALDQRVVILRFEIAVAKPCGTRTTPLEVRMLLAF